MLNEILERVDLFPKELFPRAVKKYREDYLNYYLLCNFIKAVSPYFAERTESIFSEIVEGILRYTFYHPDEYKKRSIESGFDYLLHHLSHGGKGAKGAVSRCFPTVGKVRESAPFFEPKRLTACKISPF